MRAYPDTQVIEQSKPHIDPALPHPVRSHE